LIIQATQSDKLHLRPIVSILRVQNFLGDGSGLTLNHAHAGIVGQQAKLLIVFGSHSDVDGCSVDQHVVARVAGVGREHAHGEEVCTSVAVVVLVGNEPSFNVRLRKGRAGRRRVAADDESAVRRRRRQLKVNVYNVNEINVILLS